MQVLPGRDSSTVTALPLSSTWSAIAIERLADTVKDAGRDALEWSGSFSGKDRRRARCGWFIHHDADEFRESPWPHLSLNRAIQQVDALGFNAIDFAGLDFWPVHDGFRAGDDVRETFTRYSETETFDRVQIRCWKKVSDVDLVSSGGHQARFRDQGLSAALHPAPLSIRGQARGRKVFENDGAVRQQERAPGWQSA